MTSSTTHGALREIRGRNGYPRRPPSGRYAALRMNRRIAYLTSVYARAGDTFIRREVEELRRLGWDVRTFSIRRADEGPGIPEPVLREQRSTEYILEQGVLPICGAFARETLRAPRRMLRAIRQAGKIRGPGLRSLIWHACYLLEAAYLAGRLRELQVGLLHDHIAMNSATVAMLASTLSGVPFSMTVHGPHDFFEPERNGLGRKIVESSLTVCISEFGKSQCMLFTPPSHWNKLHVVRCGVDAEFLEPERGQCDPARLISVGRLCPEKGQILLVQAVAALRDQGCDVELLLVGDGPSRHDVEREASRLRVERSIRLLGWRSSRDVRRLILESRALVLSSFAEGIPVVLMEAMALGRPVIAPGVGGIPELVQTGENGWLVPAGSVEDLAGAMRQLVESPAERLDQMGERGRRRILERHDVSREVRRLAALFEQTIEGSATQTETSRSHGLQGIGVP